MLTALSLQNSSAASLLALSVLLLAGFLVTRLTKLLRLPNVTGFILAGILVGPSALDLVPQTLIHDASFVSDLALSFIAFGAGSYFQKEALRGGGRATLLVTVMESVPAGILVTLTLKLLFPIDWGLALLLGAIATATAPASTLMTIRQYGARGPFVNLLLQVVALDDVVCLLVYSVVAALLSAGGAAGVWRTLGLNLAAMALGVLCGLLLPRLLTPKRSADNRLILTVAFLIGIAGLCAAFDVSPLLACMLFAAVYINRTGDQDLFTQVSGFTPPILSLFFVLSGINLDLGALKSFGLLGVAYFFVRILGKYLGAAAGCKMAHMEARTARWLGAALVPQAGVAIGLAFLARRMLPGELGDALLTVILASSVLYELVGPACAKLALRKSGSFPEEEGEAAEPCGGIVKES